MPPKSNKKKGAAAALEDEADKPVEVPVPTEREVQLTKQLEDVTVELKSMRTQVEELKQVWQSCSSIKIHHISI